MRVTQFSDIGLRVLIYLSKADDERAPATIAEIASQFDIAINHLVKVVGHMARVGWIQATRGRNGGIRLAIEPPALRIGSVLRELEGDAELVDCNARQCGLSQDCRLRSALAEGLRAFYESLDRYTLADMTAGGTGEKIVRMHRAFLAQTRQSA
jgi:Rrf2 family nitric oxide-sensitive transcriptional repressor